MPATDEVSPTARPVGPLQWSVLAHAHEIEVVLSGELDLATADSLTELLTELARRGPAQVVCDLAEVSFLDSTGIRALLQAADSAAEAGTVLLVRRPTPAVLRVLEICGVDAVLLHGSREDTAERR